MVVADLRGYGDSGKPRRTARSQQLLVPAHGTRPGRGHGGARASTSSSSPAATRAPHGLSHGARPSRRRSASLPVLISFHALPLDACQPGVGAQFVSLDLHDAALRYFRSSSWRARNATTSSRQLTAMGIGKGGFRPETIAEYTRCCTPAQLHAVCEDYRAGATIDFADGPCRC